jgi:hypothetical protein
VARRVEFFVDGYRPPRKRDAKSLWAHKKEAPLVKILRIEAAKACSQANIDYFESKIHLELVIFTPSVEGVGDLDSFISGICDGLQAADQNVQQFHESILDDDKINPRKSILVGNDRTVVSIKATKEQRDKIGYKVIVTEM